MKGPGIPGMCPPRMPAIYCCGCGALPPPPPPAPSIFTGSLNEKLSENWRALGPTIIIPVRHFSMLVLVKGRVIIQLHFLSDQGFFFH